MGKPIRLELDHIDSNHFNNNLDNLQILCPNCHAHITHERNIKRKKQIKEINKKKFKIIRLRPETRKIKNRPDLNQLLEDVKLHGYSATGRKYNVSDNCIRKWIKLETKIQNNGNIDQLEGVATVRS